MFSLALGSWETRSFKLELSTPPIPFLRGAMLIV